MIIFRFTVHLIAAILILPLRFVTHLMPGTVAGAVRADEKRGIQPRQCRHGNEYVSVPRADTHLPPTGRGISSLRGCRPSLSQPAVVGVGAGGLAAGDVGPADAAGAGLACASAVVVTGPAELPFSQADQDSCQ